MIVAGIGCRAGVSEAEVVAAIDAACAHYCIEATDIGTLAVVKAKSQEPAIQAAAQRLARPLVIVQEKRLKAVESRTLSHSPLSLEVTGASSASESAALAAAGANSRLLGPRIAVGPVTCAIAIHGARS